MAFAYFGSASNPADNGTNSGSTSVTPPGSMVEGQLVILVAQEKTSGGLAPIGLTTTGGQTWTQIGAGQIESDTIAVKMWFCRYNGTWSANPTVSSAGTAMTLVMHVFDPTSSTQKFFVDKAYRVDAFSSPGPGVATTITGITTLNPSTVTIGIWFVKDNPTWGSISGTGWVTTGSAQYRNSASSDQCCTFGHNIQTSVGTTADASKTMGALNKNSGYTVIFSIQETTVSVKVLGKVKVLGNVKVL